MVRYEGAYTAQLNGMSEFKQTAAAATTLLETLQQSADSIKDMVRYEINRAFDARDGGRKSVEGNPDTVTEDDDGETGKRDASSREVDDLRERIKKLEERLDKSDPIQAVEPVKAADAASDIEASVQA